MPKLLYQKQEANDIKKMEESSLNELAKEIRHFLIGNISKTGGHLASNLGTVELTIAIHRRLDFPKDKLVWDVGHQAYTHKILTGRKTGFPSLRQYG
ncbi:MAG: 1-deoxy-D-xylulose-5-phosphate synthase N-terminal domain-containing protein, partial [Acetivibrio sp.]